MYYATIDNKIGQSESLPTNAIEISAEQYKSLMSDKMQGKRVTVENKQSVTYTECYSTTGEKLTERDPEQPLIITKPADGLHKPKWSKGKWAEGETAAEKAEREESDIEQLADTVRAERDQLIESVRWRIERHSDELALGREPTEPLEPLLQYVQDLRDVPQQTGFPEAISWPVLSE